MKKFLILLLIAFCIFGASPRAVLAEDDSYVKVIYTQISIFSETDVNSETNQIITTASYGQKLKLSSNSIITSPQDGYNYYKIALELEEYDVGYVFVSQVCPVEYSSLNRVLATNAEVCEDAIVYYKENETYYQTETIIPNGTKIRILSGYDKAKAYTRIQYQQEDGEIVTNYIMTSQIKVSGISRTTIGAICIIVTTVTLVLIFFGIKGKTKKKSK